MPTPAWREEKSENVVKAICRALTSSELPQSAREILESEALWNSLKLFSNALEERLDSSESRWSPALVELFVEKPSQCNEWLALMSEPDFSAAGYWKK
jgi:hypothetical protein